MRKYEAVFILNEKKVEGGSEAFADQVENLIKELGGNVSEKDNMGRRQFARPIGKQKAGFYWDFVFHLEAAKVEKLKDKYRLNEGVLRLAVFNFEEPSKKTIKAEKAKAEKAKAENA